MSSPPRPSGSSVTWTVYPPPRRPVGWLDELRAFRARVLYDDGRRPCFRTPDGGFADPDPADLDAYHIVTLTGNGFAGCVRLLPLEVARTGLCEQLLGSTRLEAVLARLGTTRAHTAETGGWVLDRHHRSTALAFRQCALVAALAEYLGLQMLIGANGTRDGQARALKRIAGYHAVPELHPIPVPRYDDEVRICYTRGLDSDGRPRLQSIRKQLLSELPELWAAQR